MRCVSSRHGLTRIKAGHYVNYDDEEGVIGQLRRRADGAWEFKLKRGQWFGDFPRLADARPALYSAYLDRRMEEIDGQDR
ncbi:MAG: hypothetical protein AAF531_10425 [Actinomycetota bacterium]